jgi:hypothetical protein
MAKMNNMQCNLQFVFVVNFFEAPTGATAHLNSNYIKWKVQRASTFIANMTQICLAFVSLYALGNGDSPKC